MVCVVVVVRVSLDDRIWKIVWVVCGCDVLMTFNVTSTFAIRIARRGQSQTGDVHAVGAETAAAFSMAVQDNARGRDTAIWLVSDVGCVG